jgi:carboxyl-terminal processing protease
MLLGLALAWPLSLPAQGHWPDTKLDFGHLKRVALAKCYDNLDELVGCYRAAGGALGTGSDLRLTAAEPGPGDTVLLAFGPVRLVRGAKDDSPASVREFWARLIEQRRSDAQALEAHLADAGAARIEFDAIVDFIATLVPKDRQPALAARGINEYFAVVIDPHTQISTRRDLADAMSGADRSYAGVGISVFRLGTRYLVTAVTPGGPADAAGVKPDDFLERIDATAASGLSLDQLIAAVRGKAGTTVELGLSRNGAALTVTVPRREIIREALESRLLESGARRYGYLRIQDFMVNRICDRTASALRQQDARGAKGWVLDLRGNPGGSITASACVAGLFLDAGELVAYRIDGETRQRRDYTTSGERLTRAPLVVLVDAASASGSELLAGAIQHHRRGWIVGEPTFGKGSTQSIRAFRIPGTTGLVRNETTGLFFLPDGRTSQIAGITPDFIVAPGPDGREDLRFTPREKDLYLRPIRHEQPPWTSPRPDEARRVSACVAANGKARARLASSATQSDYPLLYALDVLDCR